MADYRRLMPFILHCETSTPFSEPFERMFDLAKAKGVAFHKADKGAHTLCGITIATYREFCRRRGLPRPSVDDLAHLSVETWIDIYKSMFWDRWRADYIANADIAAAVVDWTWVSGAHGIVRPQKVLGVKPDGIVGPKTLEAINSHRSPQRLLAAIAADRKAFHSQIAPKGSANRVFLRGWNARVDRLIAWLDSNKIN